MKTTVHVCKRSPGKRDIEHNYRAYSKRSMPERDYEGSRVVFIEGNSRGVGVIMRKPGFELSMMDVISGPHAMKRGRPLRQIILSSEDQLNASESHFESALSQLVKAAAKWVDAYAPGSRWVAFAHRDRNHPHVHLIVENWDYEKNRRLDLRPSALSLMQNMEWASGLGLASGKGSTGRVKAGKRLADDGASMESLNFQERVQLLAWNSFKGGKEAALELFDWCREKKPSKTVEGIVSMLDMGPLPPGWVLRARTKRGSMLRKPSVVIGGRHLRIGTFLDVWLGRVQPKVLSGKTKKVDANDIGL